MTLLRRTAPVAAIAIAATLAACGSDSGDAALSKKDLVAKMNAICTDADKQSKSIEQPTNIADATQAAPYFAALARLAKSQHEDISALEPADDVKVDFEAYLAEEQKAIDLVDGLAKAAAAKDAAKGAELLQQVNDNTSYKAAADKLGADACAQ